MNSANYRLRAPLFALKCDVGDRLNLHTLNVGMVVSLASEVRESGLVEVNFAGVIYTVFYTDVCERGDRVR